jgi:hypothetical protein
MDLGELTEPSDAPALELNPLRLGSYNLSLEQGRNQDCRVRLHALPPPRAPPRKCLLLLFESNSNPAVEEKKWYRTTHDPATLLPWSLLTLRYRRHLCAHVRE